MQHPTPLSLNLIFQCRFVRHSNSFPSFEMKIQKYEKMERNSTIWGGKSLEIVMNYNVARTSISCFGRIRYYKNIYICYVYNNSNKDYTLVFWEHITFGNWSNCRAEANVCGAANEMNWNCGSRKEF